MDNETTPITKRQFGKFKSADALYKAYRYLETAFTKRCTELKQYKMRNAECKIAESPVGVASFPCDPQVTEPSTRSVVPTLPPFTPLKSSSAALFAGPAIRAPKTLEEAGALARLLLL